MHGEALRTSAGRMGLSRGCVICRVSSRLDGACGLAEEGGLFPGREVLWEEVRGELLDGILESHCSFATVNLVSIQPTLPVLLFSRKNHSILFAQLKPSEFSYVRDYFDIDYHSLL